MTHDSLLIKRCEEKRKRRLWKFSLNGAFPTDKFLECKVTSRKTIHHLYLCDEHAGYMLDFMEAYEGKEKDA